MKVRLIPTRVAGRYVTLGRKAAPRLLEKRTELARIDVRDPHEHPRPAAIMVRDVESFWIGSNQDLARGVLGFEDQRLTVLVKAGKQFSADFEGGCPVGGPFLNAGQRECKLTHRVESDRLAFARTLLRLRLAQVSLTRLC